MKQIGFTFMLFVIVLSPLAAACQALPDSPKPAPSSSGAGSTQQQAIPPISDREWRHIEQLRYGEPIDVASTYGPPLRCRFAGASDDTLFCDAPGSPDGTSYRFERAAVIYVKLLAPQPKPNYHPAWISSMIAGGIVVGLCATRTTDDGGAAVAGVVGAAVVGAIGAPMAFLNGDQSGVPGPVIFGARALVRVPIRMPRLPRRIVPILH